MKRLYFVGVSIDIDGVTEEYSDVEFRFEDEKGEAYTLSLSAAVYEDIKKAVALFEKVLDED